MVAITKKRLFASIWRCVGMQLGFYKMLLFIGLLTLLAFLLADVRLRSPTIDKRNPQGTRQTTAGIIPQESHANATKYEEEDSEAFNIDLDYLAFLIKHTFLTDRDPKYEFNESLSNSLPLNRKLKDYRHTSCRDHRWDIDPALRVSFIIPFINEPWSTLFRTVFSILGNSPLKYVHEIILVDDHSDRDYLLEPLDRLLHLYDQLTVIRTPFKMGPGGTRNFGARHAKGTVLLFVDSHCEVNAGWLEPLLEAISRDPTRLVVPNLDTLNLDTFLPNPSPENIRVQMTWSLGASFGFYRKEVFDKIPITDPIPQMSLMGAVFAVDKEFFFRVGGIGEYFLTWGGEDVDLAIKYWLCGGSVVKCRCSRAAHLYKPRPYQIVKNPLDNVALMAEAWLDEYLAIFKCVEIPHRVIPKVTDKSVLQSTYVLKKKLKCRSFKWFLNNIYQELEVPEPNTTFIKPVLNYRFYLIATAENKTVIFTSKIATPSFCSIALVDDRIKCKGTCLTVDGSSFSFKSCTKNDKKQMWNYNDSEIHPYSDNTMCLSRSQEQSQAPLLIKCEKEKAKITFESQFSTNCIKQMDYNWI